MEREITKPREYELEKYRPFLSVPEFWPSRLDDMERQFAGIRRGRVETIGYSYCGRKIRAVRYGNPSSVLNVAVIAGEHGTETTGIAGIFNLISFLEKGVTLHSKVLDDVFKEYSFSFIPVVNPDSRARHPDTLVGLVSGDCSVWAYGFYKDGSAVPSLKQIDTGGVKLLGAKYNDQGIDIAADGDAGALLTPEMKAVYSFFDKNPFDLLINIHCAQQSVFLPGTYMGIPADQREKLWKLKQSVTLHARECGYYMDDPHPDRSLNHPAGWRSYEMLMQELGGWALLLETPPGFIDCEPRYTHEELVDLTLFLIKDLCQTAVQYGLKNPRL